MECLPFIEHFGHLSNTKNLIFMLAAASTSEVTGTAVTLRRDGFLQGHLVSIPLGEHFNGITQRPVRGNMLIHDPDNIEAFQSMFKDIACLYREEAEALQSQFRET